MLKTEKYVSPLSNKSLIMITSDSGYQIMDKRNGAFYDSLVVLDSEDLSNYVESLTPVTPDETN